jgi:molybdopterin molybdotransferase
VIEKVESAAVRASDPSVPLALDEAIKKIQSTCGPLPAVSVPLDAAFGRVLRATVCAAEDMPSCDRSTRDGYAILQDDPAETFHILDTLHAADWRPRQLKSGEAVRVATGTALPCGGLRVVMQEHAGRNGDNLRILKRETVLNIRRRGEDVKAGQPLVLSGTRLDAGKLSLLAAAGCTQPLVSPHVRVIHFTTGDEIVPPDQTSTAGQIRDSNSILIWALLRSFQVELEQSHLPENLEAAWTQLDVNRIATADLVLVSGGASVGDRDFTRPLLERLGFEIVFSQVNVRPGRPLIFGVNGLRAAFGLPGNPLSHFVCFHFAVTLALARLTGGEDPRFLRGRLAVALDDAACARETLWPARFGQDGMHPLPWASSGDVTCFATANALIRVPANNISLPAGMMVDFLPAGGNLSG